MLTMREQTKILKDVILGTPAPAAESDEARQFRKHCEHDAATARANGHMLEIPFMPDEDDEEGGEGAPPETFRHSE